MATRCFVLQIGDYFNEIDGEYFNEIDALSYYIEQDAEEKRLARELEANAAGENVDLHGKTVCKSVKPKSGNLGLKVCPSSPSIVFASRSASTVPIPSPYSDESEKDERLQTPNLYCYDPEDTSKTFLGCLVAVSKNQDPSIDLRKLESETQYPLILDTDNQDPSIDFTKHETEKQDPLIDFNKHETKKQDHSIDLNEHDTKKQDHSIDLNEHDTKKQDPSIDLEKNMTKTQDPSTGLKNHDTKKQDSSIGQKKHDTEKQDSSIGLQTHENKKQDSSIGLKKHKTKKQDSSIGLKKHETKKQDSSIGLKKHVTKKQDSSIGLKKHEANKQEPLIDRNKHETEKQDQSFELFKVVNNIGSSENKNKLLIYVFRYAPLLCCLFLPMFASAYPLRMEVSTCTKGLPVSIPLHLYPGNDYTVSIGGLEVGACDMFASMTCFTTHALQNRYNFNGNALNWNLTISEVSCDDCNVTVRITGQHNVQSTHLNILGCEPQELHDISPGPVGNLTIVPCTIGKPVTINLPLDKDNDYVISAEGIEIGACDVMMSYTCFVTNSAYIGMFNFSGDGVLWNLTINEILLKNTIVSVIETGPKPKHNFTFRTQKCKPQNKSESVDNFNFAHGVFIWFCIIAVLTLLICCGVRFLNEYLFGNNNKIASVMDLETINLMII